MKDFSRLIRETQFLPPAFQLVPRLLLLLDESENASSDDLADLIRVDAGLTADLLGVCNSAYFGASTRVETVHEAIFRLGLREIYRVLLKVISMPLMTSPQPEYGLDEANLWNHSLAVATAAKFLTQEKRGYENVAFTAGLLHDVGKIVFTQVFRGDYQNIVKESNRLQQPLPLTEKSYATLDHAEVGAELLRKWNFPESIIAAVRFHHDPWAAGEHKELAALVHVANLLAFYISQGSGHQGYALFFDHRCLELLGFSKQMLEDLTADIGSAFDKELAAFI